MKAVSLAVAPAGVLVLALLAGPRAGMAQDGEPPDGQALWRSCSSCHCVPDPRIPADEDWLRLNETTTCISGDKDTPAARAALIAYLRAETTIRPILIDERGAPPAGAAWGTVRVPSTAGSAYLKAERTSVREGSPPKIRLSWNDSEKGVTLSVPPGTYRVISYGFYRMDTERRRWTASGSSAEGCAQLVIRNDADAAFDLEPVIQAHLGCKDDGSGVVFGFFMTNRNAQRMSLSREGRLVDPGWVVTDAAGKRIDAGDFEVT